MGTKGKWVCKIIVPHNTLRYIDPKDLKITKGIDILQISKVIVLISTIKL